MKKILFICQANVGRSQMAEGFYNFMTNSNNAISAGIEDKRQKYNFRPTTLVVDAMNEKGIDISRQKIKMITPQLSSSVEQIVVLCNKSLCPSYIVQDEKACFFDVTDPFGMDIEFLRKTRDKIENIVKGLL